jgi:hypothetical protein
VKKASWFLIFLFFAVSCLDDPDCYLLNNDVVGITFRVLGSTTADSVTVNRFTLNDNLVFDGDTTITAIYIRADRFNPVSLIKLTNPDGEKLMDLSYRVQVQFVSEECGPRYVLSELAARDHNFDSLNVINPSPGRDAGVNIIAYRCPNADTIELKLLQLTLPKTGASSSRPISALFNSISYEGSPDFYAGKRAATVRLPIDLNSDQLTYTFSFADDFGYDKPVRDLPISYVRTTEKRYEQCGEQTFVTDLEIVDGAVPFDVVSIPTNSDDVAQNVVTDPIQTNFNVYRCPPTNIVQLAFVTEGTTQLNSTELTSVTADYTDKIFYADTTLSRIQLPLNPNGTSTQFTIEANGFSRVITLNYTWSAPRTTLFAAGSSCLTRQVITNLSVTTNTDAAVTEPAVLFPAVTNVNVEVPE